MILSGCGHAGIVNTVEYARKVVRAAPIHAVVGGLHLFALDDERLDWTADQLKAPGLENLLGAHCTGIEAVYQHPPAGGPRPQVVRRWARWGRLSCSARASIPATWRADGVGARNR